MARLATSQSTPFPIANETSNKDETTPYLPPHIQSVRSHTADDILNMMSRTPLFMTSLDDADDDDNVELEALRQLQYEGTTLEIASGFREQGNEMTKAKRWKDGKEFYTKAIAVLAQKVGPTSGADMESLGTAYDDSEARKEKELEEVCCINRALCNLELKNYRSTTLDCASALRLNSKNVKAYYRSATALLALNKLVEASDACRRGLAIDPTSTALQTLNRKIQGREKELKAAEVRKQQEVERKQKEQAMLSTALRARNIRLRNTSQPPDMEDAVIHLSPDPLSPTSALHFPVVLLYPLHAQSDFIKAFPETDNLVHHLDYILPLPWDKDQEYTRNAVECYVEKGKAGLVKVGKKVSLGEILSQGDFEIVDSIVRINVIPKGKAASWIETMRVRGGK